MRRAACGALLAAALGCHAPLYDVAPVTPRPDTNAPRVLCVVAHPDDEIAFAATMYKASTMLGARCDVVLITNGEGGFKYATLAEPLYGRPLSDEAVGRAELPVIRRREFLEGCRYMGVHRAFFLDQIDHRYTLDPHEVLDEDAGVWDLTRVRAALDTILAEGEYDFVFTHLPHAETHGHHKAATILALEAVLRRPPAARPVALGARTRHPDRPAPDGTALEGFPITASRTDVGPFVFDRHQRFGYRDRLHYGIVVDWAIAAHKSQGTMQLIPRGDAELYALYTLNDEEDAARAAAFFDALEAPQFEARRYGPSAEAPRAP